MVAIKVKYIPCSNFKGVRLKAECGDKSVTISEPDHLHRGEETYFEAVKAFCLKHCRGWLGVVWAAGYLEKTHEYVFTYICKAETEVGQVLAAEGRSSYGFFVSEVSADPMVSAMIKAGGGK